MNKEIINKMVDKFLQWRLPENFKPDGGISFRKYFNEDTAHPLKNEPTGTNLFDAIQTTEMIKHILGNEQIGPDVNNL